MPPPQHPGYPPAAFCPICSVGIRRFSETPATGGPPRLFFVFQQPRTDRVSFVELGSLLNSCRGWIFNFFGAGHQRGGIRSTLAGLCLPVAISLFRKVQFFFHPLPPWRFAPPDRVCRSAPVNRLTQCGFGSMSPMLPSLFWGCPPRWPLFRAGQQGVRESVFLPLWSGKPSCSLSFEKRKAAFCFDIFSVYLP